MPVSIHANDEFCQPVTSENSAYSQFYKFGRGISENIWKASFAYKH